MFYLPKSELSQGQITTQMGVLEMKKTRVSFVKWDLLPKKNILIPILRLN